MIAHQHNRFITWVRTHQRLSLILLGGILIAIAGGVTAYLLSQPEPTVETPVATTPPPKEPEPIKYYSPLTGAVVKNEAATKRTVTAMMLGNSPEARPQSGIKNSGVVFEAIAEGGITRFLVLYQNEQPKLIGPVRSLRMYYVDWLAPFNAAVGHVGGSQKALKEIRNGKYRDIDEFFNGTHYWRATDRYAPHNVYTNFSRLNALYKQKKYTSSSFVGFTREDSEASEAPNATRISVRISSDAYNSSYRYNKKTNTYDRYQGGAKHLDREGGQISPRVVIAMVVQEQTVLEDGWREQINAVGKGTAHIFQDGIYKKVTWQKKSRAAQITFTDSKGNDVPLARGQTWITAVPQGHGGVSWR